MRDRRLIGVCAAAVALLAGVVTLGAGPAGAVNVSDEAQLRAAFADTTETSVVLTSDITLTDCGAGQVLRPAASAALVLSGPFTITQTCAGERVIGSAGDTGALTIDGATITGGDLVDGSGLGGGVFWSGDVTLDGATVTANTVTSVTSPLGGGLFVNGALVVRGSTVSDNSVISTSTFGALAGAMHGGSSVLVVDSVVSGNTAGAGTTFGGTGGAIFGNSNVTVIRSTFVGNVAQGSATNSGNGGAIVINGALTVINSTITGNTAGGATSINGGIASGLDLLLLYSTVVGNSAASGANVQGLSNDPSFSNDEVFGNVIANPLGGGANCGPGSDDASTGYNFSDDASCNLGGTGDRQSAGSPGLGALGANGGPTPTMLPSGASPLLDFIPPADCRTAETDLDTDQRAITRPQGTGCDIGAVEVAVVQAPTTTTTTTTTTTVPGGPTAPPAPPVVADPDFAG